MTDLNDYYYFVHIVEKGGFAPAGRALNVPKSRLSRHVSALEARLGVRLLHRSSRHFSVTDIGAEFYRHARLMLDQVEAAEALVNRQTQGVSGTVRLSCSIGVAQFALSKLMGTFMQTYPAINLVLQVTNETVNLLEDGLDLALRAHMGPLPDSSMVQRTLGNTQWLLFASSRYLDIAGRPCDTSQLAQHVGLKLGWRPQTGNWCLFNKDGIEASVPFSPRFCCDDISSLKQAAIEGLGIVALPGYTCKAELTDGTLERVLPDWHAGVATFSLLMPTRAGIQPGVQVLADYLKAKLPPLISVS
ncbi:LysR substrate-binding domain-containing protein [Shewanella corallii]|uniref:LysR substrate-binding domain-containing protein n=1 Tax=Shewanella corallii TaxID=560080 RepID=A0ABT0N2W6_9GAMM|nr:LysR substrate-binding domain-containing protein [Shewanella corallii]MCL2912794.1 LysR substrate-binding domain-containing protein [Shewanella corallii]